MPGRGEAFRAWPAVAGTRHRMERLGVCQAYLGMLRPYSSRRNRTSDRTTRIARNGNMAMLTAVPRP